MDKIRLFYPEKLEENKELKIADEEAEKLTTVGLTVDYVLKSLNG